MSTEELLARVQKESKGKLDEREKQLMNKGVALGFETGMILCGIIMLLQLFVTKKIQADCYVVYFGMSSVMYVHSFIKLKSKNDLIVGIICSMLFLLFLATFIVQMFGL